MVSLGDRAASAIDRGTAVPAELKPRTEHALRKVQARLRYTYWACLGLLAAAALFAWMGWSERQRAERLAASSLTDARPDFAHDPQLQEHFERAREQNERWVADTRSSSSMHLWLAAAKLCAALGLLAAAARQRRLVRVALGGCPHCAAPLPAAGNPRCDGCGRVVTAELHAFRKLAFDRPPSTDFSFGFIAYGVAVGLGILFVVLLERPAAQALTVAAAAAVITPCAILSARAQLQRRFPAPPTACSACGAARSSAGEHACRVCGLRLEAFAAPPILNESDAAAQDAAALRALSCLAVALTALGLGLILTALSIAQHVVAAGYAPWPVAIALCCGGAAFLAWRSYRAEIPRIGTVWTATCAPRGA